MFRLASCMRLIGTMMLSDGTHQNQRGGLGSTNIQTNKIEFHTSDSAARGIVQDGSDSNIARRKSLDAIRGRVFELMERHGIDLPTVAEILEVPLSMLGREEWVDRLDNPTLERLVNLFCVKREWLVGQDKFPMQHGRRWYYETVWLVRHLLKLEKEGLQPEIYFLKPAHMNADKAMEEEGSTYRVGISIARAHKTPSGRTFKTFEPWDWEPWNYQKSRIDFLSIVMIFDRLVTHKLAADMENAGMEDDCFWCKFNRIGRRAISVDHDAILKYEDGKRLLCELIGSRPAWGSAWFPDVFTARPMGSKAKPEIEYIEERYFDILKALAFDVRRSRWVDENRR